MASIIYNSGLLKMVTGLIDIDTDTIKVLLLPSTYVPDFALHDFRDDLGAEITGTGYTAGGNTATCSAAIDTANTPDQIDITLGGTSWPSSTITARYAAYYKARGGLASADELIALNDFGADVSSSSGTFTLNASTLSINLTGQG